MWGQILLLIAVVVFSAFAVLAKDLIKSAISLAVASLFLGLLFFQMRAPYAGVFEISVVAGLITVLFMLVIALTKTGGDVRESKLATLGFPLFFVVFAVIDLFVMKGLLAKLPALAGPAESGTFGDVLWKQRTFDLVGQLGVILAGVFAVLALFRKRDNKDE
jgi:NADH:ubiquinone oxidoreductase subunit 6 (subunit J)